MELEPVREEGGREPRGRPRARRAAGRWGSDSRHQARAPLGRSARPGLSFLPSPALTPAHHARAHLRRRTADSLRVVEPSSPALQVCGRRRRGTAA